VNEYARVLYARHGNIELNLDKSFKDNYVTQQEKERQQKESISETLFITTLDYLETTDKLKFTYKLNSKSGKLNSQGTADSIVSFKWSVVGPNNAKPTFSKSVSMNKPSDEADTAEVNFPVPGKYSISLTVTTLDNKKIPSKVLTDYITVLDKSQTAYINSQRQKAGINSRQDIRKYQFNSPSNYYTSNGRKLTSQDKAQFEVLDDLNSLLDTAIYLYNKGNTVKSSAYIETVLFGSKTSTKIINSDIRSPQVISTIPDAEPSTHINDTKQLLTGIYMNIGDAPEWRTIFGAGNGKDTTYLQKKFPNYDQDPTITTWLLNLRNGLSEYTIESRGKQRWRNVTEEENIGRLNYRKDDYIDYLDGDLESSIFYNNTKRKEDINSGRLSAKNTVYQSQHENRDLNDEKITENSSGWPTTLISDRSKVYKGGSWADRAYWLSAGNRRFLDEDKSSATIGFRCAMDRLGGQPNLNYKKRKRN
jgi:hypothetical protein